MLTQTILLAMSRRAWLTRRAVDGIASYARKRTNWDLMLVTKEGMAVLPTPGEVGARGAIVSLQESEIQLYAHCPEPVVTLESTSLLGIRPRVGLDNTAVGKMAAKYFAGRGYRHFAYIGSGKSPSDARRDGFRQGAFEAVDGITFRILPGGLRMGHRSHAHVLADLTTWLRHLPLPLALLACNDDHAVVVVQACRLAGLRVPEDVAVLGTHDDDMYTDLGHVPLSSIAVAGERMGYEAATILDAMLRGKPVPARETMIPPIGVVTRRSTDSLAVEDEQVQQALRWIAAHLGKPFGIDDLLEAVPMSRSSLERRFKAVLDRTPHEEILRQRIELARSVLVDTNWSLPKITAHCGFSRREYFGTVFKKLTGETPVAYRTRFMRGRSEAK